MKRRWVPGAEAEVPPPRWHAVEHHAGGRVRALGRVPDAYPHRSSLAPFLSRLLLAGAAHGELLLVEEATERVVARRAVRRPERPS